MSETTSNTSQGTVIRRLTRRTDDKVVAGVASGLGHYFGVDPVLFRIGFVVLTITGGLGLLLYAAAWIVLPESTGSRVGEPPIRRISGFPTWAGILLLVVGASLLVSQIGPWQPSLVWGVVLVGLGVVLFRRETRPEGSEPATPPSLDATDPASATVTAPVASPASGAEPIVRPQPRERSPLGWYTIGALFVAIGTAAVLDDAGVVHLRPVQYLALALAVLGVGLLVGTIFGHARLLIIPALLLTPLVFAASVIRVPFTGGFGERSYAPRSISGVQNGYHLVAGDITFDLSNLDFSTPITINATVAAGQIKVFVPRGVQVDARARVGGGDVLMFGKRSDGLGLDQTTSASPSESDGHLTLDLQVGLGQVYVYGQPIKGSR
ncbi:MAG: PspC domain-containing protein [Actinomycetota bacterium]